jgi:hypothetical protein
MTQEPPRLATAQPVLEAKRNWIEESLNQKAVAAKIWKSKSLEQPSAPRRRRPAASSLSRPVADA